MNRIYARKRRQLRHVLKQTRRALAVNPHAPRLAQLRQRIERLLAELRGVVPQRTLLRMAGGLATVLGLSIAPAAAQNFAPAVNNPFGLGNNATSMSDFGLVDLDGDGDLDLIGREFSYYNYFFSVVFQENVGTPNAPVFAAPASNPFGQVTQYDGWDGASLYGGLSMEVADLDGDGDFDLLFVDRYGYAYNYSPYAYGYFENPVVWVENTGTPTAPSFSNSGVIEPFGLSFGSLGNGGQTGVYGIELTDIDGDGDLDVLGVAVNFDYYTGGPTHGFFWSENAGSATSPEFLPLQQEPFGLHSDLAVPAGEGLSFHLDAVDVDLDGDLDLLESVYFEGGATGYLTELHFIENTGSASAPQFAAPVTSPFGLIPSPADGIVVSGFADLDGDGDPDALHVVLSEVMSGNASLVWYQENLGGVNGIASVQAPAALDVFPNPVTRGGQLQLGDPTDWTAYALFDAKGRQIAGGSLMGAASIAVDVPPGLYALVCTRPDGARGTRQIVVQ